ncbi:MAG TPA: gas vesicle structural protein GvpA [Burkholderiales bacterium]|nr:gas vesicle structural protein GvpA [Burkholderiales bacterium]
MAIERVGGTNLADVVDRILDKGVVIDVWVCVALVGIDILTVEARVVIASVDTFLKYAEAIRQVPPVAKPALEHQRMKALPGHLAALPVPRSGGQRRALQGRH